MAVTDMADLSLNGPDKPHLPDEILLKIISLHQLPSADAIGRERYEEINVPKGTLTKNGMYTDNDLYTGACTHRHDGWKAQPRTLSAISKTSHRFRRIAMPLLYRVYPGQSLVDPELFLRTIKSQPRTAALVMEVVIDPWDNFNGPKNLEKRAQTLDLGYALISFLQKTAKTWDDEAHAALLLFYCHNVEVLDFTCPPAAGNDGIIYTMFKQLLLPRPRTLAKSNEQVGKWQDTLAEMPLRQIKSLRLHHAEHHYIRKMASLVSLLRLPSVRSVTAYRFWSSNGALNNLNHITELSIWRCNFPPAELLGALRTCTELTSLTIVFAGFKSMLGGFHSEKELVDFIELGNVIRSTHKKLRKLRIDDRELAPPKARSLGSFKKGPALEELAVDESSLGCYGLDEGAVAPPSMMQYMAVAKSELADILPSSLQSLTIFRSNHLWHEADNGPRSNEWGIDGGFTYRFDRINDKVVELLRDEQNKVPSLQSIHIDTPLEFGRSVGQYGWRCEQVVGDEKLARPSVVTDSMVKPEERKSWAKTQDDRAEKPSLLLTRASSFARG